MYKFCFLWVPLLLVGCGVFRTNKFLSTYTQLQDPIQIEKKVSIADDYYPEVQTFSSTDLCLEAYREMKSEGYVLIGYSMFYNEGKMSQGLAVKSGKDLGAHRVLLSREPGNSGSLDEVLSEERPGYNSDLKGSPLIDALLSREDDKKTNSKTFYLHNTLFLVQTHIESGP